MGCRPIIILGMHRSGTSCLSGSLQEAGLDLGNVNTQAPYNAKGNRENRAVMDINEAVLLESGGSWDDPPAVVQWSASSKARRDAVVASYPSDQAWGFKDPRTLFTLDGWLEAIPHPRFVATIRHPEAVAGSLGSRDNMERTRAIALWERYNRRLLELHSRMPFPIVSFDVPADEYRAALRKVAQVLDLPEPRDDLSFFEPSLRTRAPAASPCATSALRLYDELSERVTR